MTSGYDQAARQKQSNGNMTQTSPDSQAYSTPTSLPRPSRRKLRMARVRQMMSSSLVTLGIFGCVLLTAVGFSAAGGVVAGQKERDVRATQTVVAGMDEQFNLGIANLREGRYELAALRFHWIIGLDPAYPGAAEWLAEAERLLSASGIGTQAPALPPSTSHNPDEIFAEAKGYFDSQQWENAITRLEELRALDPAYKTAEVRQMLWQAYKTLGLAYIRGDRIEEGLFLLDQAAAIQPLDDQTEGERRLATLYSTGKSYWGLNWPVVISNLEIVYATAPDYRDVADLLWEAYVNYGDQLNQSGAVCEAADQYETALTLRPDEEVSRKRAMAQSACDNGGGQVTPTPGSSTTPGPSPTPGATATPTPAGSLTPTPEWNIP